MDFRSKTQKRKWTEDEEEYVYTLKNKGHTINYISKKTGRSKPSITNKLRRLRKKKGVGQYDKDHSNKKHLLNQRFLKQIQPNTILDLYNAGNTQYNKYEVTTNDIDPKFDTDYHKDALELIQELYSQGKKYDLIDIDPYGTAYPLWKYGVRMVKKGIIITLGELGHKRFKRYDTVGKYYGIYDMEHFTAYMMVRKLLCDAEELGVKCKCVNLADWGYIARAYFIIR